MRRAIVSARSFAVVVLCASLGAVSTGCVTVAEFRKLESEVGQIRRGGGGGGERVADLRAQLDALDRRIAKLEGRVDESRHTADRALEEARRARQEAAGAPPGAPLEGADPEAAASTPESTPAGETGRSAAAAGAPEGAAVAAAAPPREPSEPGESAENGASVQEVSAYREAHASYRGGDYDACIDRFRRFLQTYPTSPYADDSAYWMAECHFKKGDYKSAILRFDDVVARYPEGDKSADALYRQGEALLKLGPNYAKAAGKAFERVIAEYPNSPRAGEAKKQLELLGARG
jgi:tol-pal system protein YbgF